MWSKALFKLRSEKPALLLGVVLIGSLLGCTDTTTRNKVDQQADLAQKSLDNTLRQYPSKHYNPLVVSDKIWGGDTALRMHRGTPLPPKFEATHGITLVSNAPMSLQDIAGVIGQQTGIPVHIGPGVGGNAAALPPGSASAPMATGMSANSMPGMPMGGAGLGGAGMPGMPNIASIPSVTAPTVMGGGMGSGMPVAYDGPLSGLLEHVASFFGVSWRYDGTSISLNKFETRVFTIEAMAGTAASSSSLDFSSGDGGGGSSGGGGGSSSGSSGSSGGQGISDGTLAQKIKFDGELKYWDELKDTLAAMIEDNGKIIVSQSLGTITVSTTSENMRQVADYIARENGRMSRQIAINVEIYTVSLSQGQDFTLAFNTALKKLTDNLLLNYGGASAPTTVDSFTGGGSLSVAILGSSTNQVTDVFKALSGIGDASTVAKFPLVTLNNRPSSRFVGQDINYVANVSTTSAGTTSTSGAVSNANVGTQVTPSTLKVGYSVQATPRLLDDGRILLDYSLGIKSLIQIDSFNSACGLASTASSSCLDTAAGAAGTTVQLPRTTSREFVQQAVLKSGATLVLGGAEQDDTLHNSQGVGDPYNYLLGGGLSSNRTHLMVFYAITPQVLDTPHSEQD